MKCEDMNKNKTLAIKIIKNVKKYRDAAKLEINVLKKLSNYDPDCNFKCVQMYDWFDYHGHKCIAFQLLGNAPSLPMMRSLELLMFPLNMLCCFSLPSNHCSNWTWVVEEILAFSLNLKQ